jgi:hypothetical protein
LPPDAELQGESTGDGRSLPKEERVTNAAAADFCVLKDKMNSFTLKKTLM